MEIIKMKFFLFISILICYSFSFSNDYYEDIDAELYIDVFNKKISNGLKDIDEGEYYKIVIDNLMPGQYVRISISDSTEKSINPLDLVSSKLDLPNIKIDSTNGKIKTRRYESLPIRFNGNIGKISVVVGDKDFNGELLSTSIEFPEKSNRFFSVGAGLYRHFTGGEDLVVSNRVASIYGDEVINAYESSIYQASTVEALVGITIRWNYRFNNFFSTGIIGGIGNTLSDELNPRFIYGLSLGFGKTHMFNIDAALTLGSYQERLDEFRINSVNPTYTEEPTLTKSVYKTGGTIGISYSYPF
ncbi:MAG: hypothetical protein Kapaf2KO_20600 [Candidatus Kapaibacteriales bacterium]